MWAVSACLNLKLDAPVLSLEAQGCAMRGYSPRGYHFTQGSSSVRIL